MGKLAVEAVKLRVSLVAFWKQGVQKVALEKTKHYYICSCTVSLGLPLS